MRETAKKLLKREVVYVIGWEKGRFPYQSPPAFITSAEDCDRLIWDEFVSQERPSICWMINTRKVKSVYLCGGCDSRAVNRLLQDNQIKRENVYLIGIPCAGMKDPDTGETAKNAGSVLTPTRWHLMN